MATATVTRVIEVDVKASAQAQAHIAQIAQNMRGIQAAADEANTGIKGFMGNLASAAKGLAGMWVTDKLRQYVMELNQLNDMQKQISARMDQVTGSSAKGAVAFAEIVRISKESGRELDSVAKLYEKVSRQQDQLGLTTKGVSMVTEGFAASLRLSGAGTQEANAAMLQFSQALASGKLGGDEFRSMTENNSVFMYELGKALNKTAGELKAMSKDGKLDLAALREAMFKTGEDGKTMLQGMMDKAKELPQTFDMAVAGVKAAFADYLNALGGTANQSEGILARIGKYVNRELTLGAMSARANAIIEYEQAKAMGKDLKELEAKRPKTAEETFVASQKEQIAIAVKKREDAQKGLNGELGVAFDRQDKNAIKTFRDIVAKETGTIKGLQEAYNKLIMEPFSLANQAPTRADWTAPKPIPGKPKHEKKPHEEVADDVAKLSGALDTGAKLIDAKVQEYGVWEQKVISAWAHTDRNVDSPFNKELHDRQMQKAKEMDDDIAKLKQIKAWEKANQDDEDRGKKQRDAAYEQGSKAIDALGRKKNPTEQYQDQMATIENFRTMARTTDDIRNAAEAADNVTRIWMEQMKKDSKEVGDLLIDKIDKSFDGLLNDLVDFKKSGTDIIRDFVTDVLREFAKIEMAKAMEPAKNGLFGLIRSFLPTWQTNGATGPTFTGTETSGSAFGSIFGAGGLRMLAAGGILNEPTYLGRSTDGKHNVGGEAGPEAVLPLRRGANGQLGVGQTPVTVTVVNNAPNSKASAEETTDSNGNKKIIVMVEEVMAQAIGSGRMDKVLGHNFGVSRKGR